MNHCNLKTKTITTSLLAFMLVGSISWASAQWFQHNSNYHHSAGAYIGGWSSGYINQHNNGQYNNTGHSNNTGHYNNTGHNNNPGRYNNSGHNNSNLNNTGHPNNNNHHNPRHTNTSNQHNTTSQKH